MISINHAETVVRGPVGAPCETPCVSAPFVSGLPACEGTEAGPPAASPLRRLRRRVPHAANAARENVAGNTTPRLDRVYAFSLLAFPPSKWERLLQHRQEWAPSGGRRPRCPAPSSAARLPAARPRAPGPERGRTEGAPASAGTQATRCPTAAHVQPDPPAVVRPAEDATCDGQPRGRAGGRRGAAVTGAPASRTRAPLRRPVGLSCHAGARTHGAGLPRLLQRCLGRPHPLPGVGPQRCLGPVVRPPAGPGAQASADTPLRASQRCCRVEPRPRTQHPLGPAA